MKLIKSLVMYCIIIIFIMSLTSSFELSHATAMNISQLSIKGDKMHEIFYNNQKDKKTIPDKVETEDPPTSPDTPDAPVTPDPTIDTSTEYNVGDSGDEVFKYQQLLYYMNYSQNVPDGNFGDEMKLAVEEYQTAKKFDKTGKLDAQTQQSLLAEQIEYKQGKTGDAIKDFQLILYYLDYLQSYPEGEYESGTELSVKKYQTDKSLEVTGTLNNLTQESLKKEAIVYKAGKKGTAIMEYQAVLINLGYLSGKPDGQFGTIGSNALKEYQKKNNLEQTGTIDLPSQASLKKPINEQVKF